MNEIKRVHTFEYERNVYLEKEDNTDIAFLVICSIVLLMGFFFIYQSGVADGIF